MVMQSEVLLYYQLYFMLRVSGCGYKLSGVACAKFLTLRVYFGNMVLKNHHIYILPNATNYADSNSNRGP